MVQNSKISLLLKQLNQEMNRENNKNGSIESEVQALILNSFTLNDETFHVFLDFSGNINGLSLSIDYGGWTEAGSPRVTIDFSLNKHSYTHIPKAEKKLKLGNDFLLFAKKEWQKNKRVISENSHPKKYADLFKTI